MPSIARNNLSSGEYEDSFVLAIILSDLMITIRSVLQKLEPKNYKMIYV